MGHLNFPLKQECPLLLKWLHLLFQTLNCLITPFNSLLQLNDQLLRLLKGTCLGTHTSSREEKLRDHVIGSLGWTKVLESGVVKDVTSKGDWGTSIVMLWLWVRSGICGCWRLLLCSSKKVETAYLKLWQRVEELLERWCVITTTTGDLRRFWDLSFSSLPYWSLS